MTAADAEKGAAVCEVCGWVYGAGTVAGRTMRRGCLPCYAAVAPAAGAVDCAIRMLRVIRSGAAVLSFRPVSGAIYSVQKCIALFRSIRYTVECTKVACRHGSVPFGVRFSHCCLQLIECNKHGQFVHQRKTNDGYRAVINFL